MFRPVVQLSALTATCIVFALAGRSSPDEAAESWSAMLARAGVLESMGRVDEAEDLYRAVLDFRLPDGPGTDPAGNVKLRLGLILKGRKAFVEAERLIEDACHAREVSFGPRALETLRARSVLADLKRQRGEISAALEINRAIIEDLRDATGLPAFDVAAFRSAYGVCLFESGRMDEARHELELALLRYRESVGEHHEGPRTVRQILKRIDDRLEHR